MPIRAPTFSIMALALSLLLAGLVLIEWLMGRTLFCTCGTVKLWTGDAYGPENSQMLADWYSLSHILHGLLLYGGLWLVARRWPVSRRFLAAVLIEAAWEIAENSSIVIERYRATTVALGYTGDSILNSVGDLAFMMLGFGLASALPFRWVVALGLALELIMLAAIRDNLTLNVLMLIYPIDAIRVWQSGWGVAWECGSGARGVCSTSPCFFLF